MTATSVSDVMASGAGGEFLSRCLDMLWASHLALRPPIPNGRKVYAIPRGILFRSVPLKNGPPIIDVVNLLKNFGIDLDYLLDRFKEER
jgi:hypothetical protein